MPVEKNRETWDLVRLEREDGNDHPRVHCLSSIVKATTPETTGLDNNLTLSLLQRIHSSGACIEEFIPAAVHTLLGSCPPEYQGEGGFAGQ